MNRMQSSEKDSIPLFRKWRSWYWLVIGFLLLQILLCYFFTKHFA